MQYENYPLLFQVRCGAQAPEAHNFLIPNGPRTHEYINAFNKECEEWLKGITKNEKYPENIRRTTMKYQRGDYTGRGIVYRPDTEDILPICIFTHGGSYLFWTPEYYDLMCANIAAEGNCVVVNLDFRVNIDVLIPDMMEDAYEGILETVRQASSFNADPAHIALMGDSSGGTMAMGLSIMWREVSIYAKQLTDAGVDVNVGLFQGMPHGFYNGGCGPASRDCWVFAGEALKKYLG